MAGEAQLESMIVRLLGDPSNYEKALKTSAKSTVSFAKKVNAQLQKVSQGFKNLGRKLSFRLTAPLVALGLSAIIVGANFQKGFTGVRKTVDATEQQFVELRQGFKDLSKEVPLAVEELLSIGEAAGQLGIKTENILNFARTMAAMAVATNLTSEEAATSFARFANIVGMSQDKFSNLGSSVVALGNSLATTEQEIVTMAMRLAGAGATVGLSESQIIALAASLSSVGLQAEAGGTAFSKLLLGIQTATALGGEELEQFARISKKSVQEFSQDFQDNAIGAIQDLLAAIGELDAKGKVVALKDLGLAESVRMTDAMLRMSGAVELLDNALKTSEKAFKENTALAEEATKAYASFWSQITLLKNQGKALLDDFFLIMEPTLRKIINHVKGLIIWFGELSDQTKRWAIGIGVVLALLGPLLITMGSLIGITGFLVAGTWQGVLALKTMGLAFLAMGIKAQVGWAMATLGISLIIPALIGVVAALVKIQKETGVFDPFIDAAKEIWGVLKNELGPAILELGTTIKNELGPVLEVVMEVMVAMIHNVIPSLIFGIHLLGNEIERVTGKFQLLVDLAKTVGIGAGALGGAVTGLAPGSAFLEKPVDFALEKNVKLGLKMAAKTPLTQSPIDSALSIAARVPNINSSDRGGGGEDGELLAVLREIAASNLAIAEQGDNKTGMRLAALNL